MSMEDLAKNSHLLPNSSSPKSGGSGGPDQTWKPSNDREQGSLDLKPMYSGQRQPESANGRSEPATPDLPSHPSEGDDMVDGRAEESAMD
jgi:hypothetical protein